MIKWPNDVLIEGRKTAGILSEAVWLGESLAGIVVGTGINILPQSVPPADQLQFPATCVQQHVDRPVNRFDFLEAYLKSFFALRKQLTSPQFINQWEKMLAFRGEKVYIKGNDNVIQNSGTIMGIEPNGDLRLLTADNQIETITAGDVHLRPAINRDFGRP
jgi:BirA family biotin operon repressor/biotin-[acetyl-CoA-carboxylase] ligase